jgi:hypothetical protein
VVKFLGIGLSVDGGMVSKMLSELYTVLQYHCTMGQPVKLDGLGTFTPTLSLDGTFNMAFRPDKKVKSALNTPYGFRGEIKNKEMIGKTQADIIDRWNEEHPDDPVAKPKKK